MLKTLWRLRPFVRPYSGHLLTSLALAIPLAGIRVAPAPFIKFVVDDLLVHRDASKLALFPAAFIGLFALNVVVRFFHYYLVRIVVARVNQTLKVALYRHIMGLSADYFSQQSTGGLISRVGSDTQFVDGGIYSINVLVREPITFSALLGYAFWVDWRLTLWTLAILPPLAWIFSASGKHLRRYIRRLTDENSGLFSVLQESFSGIRVIQAFRLERYVGARFEKGADRFASTLLKSAVMEEVAHPLVELVTAFAVAGVVYAGGKAVIGGRMSPGELLAFCATFALVLNPLRLLNEANIKLHAAAAATQRIFEVFDLKSRLIEPSHAQVVQGLSQGVRFESVSFAYPDRPERSVLKDVTLSIPRGAVVALVGESGSGKSSAAHLIPRIFDVTQGRIEWDGQDVRTLKLASLRAQVAIVSQDVFLFNDTVEANIRCGRMEADRPVSFEEVREAAKRAHALEFIERMPDGFASVIGERGQKLSGGERQRLAIARAFLSDAPLLILDEATSALDNASERAVQAALEELMQDRTTLLIAHRLSTVRRADQILVIHDGQIVERGTHEELEARRGEYYRLQQGLAQRQI